MMSVTCSKLTWRSAILCQIEKGCFSRPETSTRKPALGKALLDLQGNSIDLPAILIAQLLQPGFDGGVTFRLQLAEGQRLHFAHIFVHPHALGQRGVDIHRLARDALALFGRLDEMQRAHVVQPVRQLHQQHADILGHGEQELAQVFRRPLVFPAWSRFSKAW